MELEPWEALDIDDSDLSNFLRPCNNNTPTTSVSPLIPGPAGAVQSAMMQRRTLPASNLLPTQEFLCRALQNGHHSDRDFTANPWLSALQFLRSSQVDVESATPLSSIKKHLNGEGRVDRVVAVIKSCTPNGFGDMTITLKDPTGSVGATVYHRVFTEGNFGKDITVGSVLLLQKVAVFSPNGFTCYLNITLSNIIKVFSKDSGPPSEQISVKLTTPASRAETHEKPWMPLNSAFPLSHARTQGILNNIVVDLRIRELADSSKQRDEVLVSSSCHSNNGDERNQRTVSNKENLSLRQDDAGHFEVTCDAELDIEMEDQQNHPGLGEEDNLVGIAQANSSSTNSAHISVSQETGRKNNLETQKEIVNTKSSIPHWTEEQLDELLAFD